MTREDPIPTRRTLLSRLKQWDDQESWQRFFDTYWRLIYGLAVQSGLNAGEAQEVVQETVLAVAKQMPHFQYDPAIGSFKDWLFLITRRRIADHFRREYRRIRTIEPEPSTSQTAWVERVPDPGADLDALWDQEWHRNLLERARLQVKRRVEPKHFQIFDCYVIKEWPVKDVAKAFGVTANQVYLIKHRLSALLQEELKRLEKEPL